MEEKLCTEILNLMEQTIYGILPIFPYHLSPAHLLSARVVFVASNYEFCFYFTRRSKKGFLHGQIPKGYHLRPGPLLCLRSQPITTYGAPIETPISQKIPDKEHVFSRLPGGASYAVRFQHSQFIQ